MSDSVSTGTFRRLRGKGGKEASEVGGVVKSERLEKVHQTESRNQKKVLYGFSKEATKGYKS